MNRSEHLLTLLSEECAEVSQRAAKALRFGLDEVQCQQDYTNGERIYSEVQDLLAVVEMLGEDGTIPMVVDRKAINAKKVRVEKYLIYSAECGTLQVSA